jgi:hypothetical protein
VQTLSDVAVPHAIARGERSALGGRGWFTALLHNGRGYDGEALADARQACEHEDVMFYGRGLVELIEAAVRAVRPGEAAAALGRLSEYTRASATEWALGIVARCRALLNDDELLSRESIERARVQPAPVREWLRCENRARGSAPPHNGGHARFPDAQGKLDVGSRKELRAALADTSANTM